MGRLVRGVNQALLLQYYFFILSEIDALRKVKGKKKSNMNQNGWIPGERESERVSGGKEGVLQGDTGCFYWSVCFFG